MTDTNIAELTNVPEPPASYHDGMNAFRDMLVAKGLYFSIDLATPVGMSVSNILEQGVFLTFDLYCVHCKMLTPWMIKEVSARTATTAHRYTINKPPVPITVYHAVCQRAHHYYAFVIQQDAKRVTKIGQFPSTGELSFGELKAIDKGLAPQDRAELGRALGLFSHDAPAGAFVYLRRVFERMIDRAHGRYEVAIGSAIPGFKKLPMDQRIAAISDQLPPEVVEDRAVFKLLSLGVHELSDDQCMTLFPVTKAVIFQMLAEEERQRSAAALKASTKAALHAALQSFGRSAAGE